MLKTLESKVRAYANRMEKEIGPQAIEIDGATKMRGGIAEIEHYLRNVGAAIEKNKPSSFGD